MRSEQDGCTVRPVRTVPAGLAITIDTHSLAPRARPPLAIATDLVLARHTAPPNRIHHIMLATACAGEGLCLGVYQWRITRLRFFRVTHSVCPIIFHRRVNWRAVTIHKRIRKFAPPENVRRPSQSP